MLAQLEKTENAHKKGAGKKQATHRDVCQRVGEIRDRRVSRKGRRQEVAIRVYFQTEGAGSMRAGNFDTSQGTEFAWIKPHCVMGLEAKPAPGHRFSHWVVENEFAGSARNRRVVATRGMVIKAVFVPLTNQDIRC